MKEKDIIGIALVHENCPICAKKINEHIMMNSILTEENAKEIKSFHNKSIRYSKEPCDKCKEYKKQGFIFIEVDESKTEDKNNPYRTGNIWVIKKEAAKRIIINKDIINAGVSFIDMVVAKQLGLSIKEEILDEKLRS